MKSVEPNVTCKGKRPRNKGQLKSHNCKEMNSANNLSELRSNPSPPEPLMRPQPCAHMDHSLGEPEAQKPDKLCLDS